MADTNPWRKGKHQVVLLVDDVLFDLMTNVAQLEGQSMAALVRAAVHIHCLAVSAHWRSKLENFQTMGAAAAAPEPARLEDVTTVTKVTKDGRTLTKRVATSRTRARRRKS